MHKTLICQYAGLTEWFQNRVLERHFIKIIDYLEKIKKNRLIR